MKHVPLTRCRLQQCALAQMDTETEKRALMLGERARGELGVAQDAMRHGSYSQYVQTPQGMAYQPQIPAVRTPSCGRQEKVKLLRGRRNAFVA